MHDLQHLLYFLLQGLANAGVIEFAHADVYDVWRITFNGVTYEIQVYPAGD